MKNPLRSITIGLSLLFMAGGLFGQNLVFKVASITPENSPYGRVLDQINAEWIRLSNGTVRMQLIHNGAAGGEDEVLRKMRLGTIQGGMFTSVGMGRLSLPIITMSAPLLIKTDAQMKYIFSKLRPSIDKTLLQKGYAAIAYARGGWVYAFSKTPFSVPNDIRNRKIAISDTDKAFFTTFQALRYSPIPVSFNEYLTALNSGLIDTIMASPVAAAQLQWFGIAKNMLDLPLAPFMGGIIIDNRAWKRVPAGLRQTLIAAANKIVDSQLEPAAEKLEKEAVAVMVKNNLNVIPVTAEIKAAWDKEFDIGVSKLLELNAIDKKTYDQIQKLLAGFKE